MKKEQLLAMIKQRLETDLCYHEDIITYDYEVSYSCDGICRCKTIDNKTITDYKSNKYAEFLKENVINKKQIKIINDFCNSLNEDQFELLSSSGYYGEEIDGLFLCESGQKELIQLLSK